MQSIPFKNHIGNEVAPIPATLEREEEEAGGEPKGAEEEGETEGGEEETPSKKKCRKERLRNLGPRAERIKGQLK